MIKIICEKVPRVTKNRTILEKTLGVNITNRGKEVSIDGSSEDEYLAERVILALEFGFPFSVALMIKEEDFVFEIINIKEHTNRKNFEIIRARIIGKGGKTLRTLETLTECFFEIKNNKLGIIGDSEYIKNAQEAVISLIRGAKQGNVYAFLEKHRVKPVFDLGLKKVSKKKKK